MTDRRSYNRLRSAARSFWGEIQQSHTIVPGVLGVSTGGHGGIVVDPAVFPLHPALRDGLDGNLEMWVNTFTNDEVHRVAGFEEDCGWAALIYLHPVLTEPSIKRGYFAPDCLPEYIALHARQTVRTYYPELVKLRRRAA